MLFNLEFANNTILSCFFFFLFIDLQFLVPAGTAQIFNPTAELVVPLGIPTNKAKAEMETHPVMCKLQQTSGQYNSKLHKCFHASYSLMHFNLFIQLNDFLFHLFFFNLNSWLCFVQA